jgi:hypothetical protein
MLNDMTKDKTRKICLVPTMNCNFRCPNCLFRYSDLKRSRTWEKEDIQKTMSIIKRSMISVKVVSILGGEPSLWPHLPILIDELHKAAIKVQIVTNGTGSIERYGNADVIRVTDYGASNNWMYYNLRRQLGRRVHYHPSVHVPLNIPWTEKVQCNCFGWVFVGDMLYRCGEQASRGICGIPIDNDTCVRISEAKDPRTEHCCHTCFSNKEAYNRVAPPIMAQISIWGVEEANWVFRLPIPRAARKYYSKLRRLRGR